MPADASVPVVSVVIPTFGHAEFVLDTLASVFAQSFADTEVIVVNDGSPDNTAEVLRPLVEAGRIRYVEQQNAGQAAARNRGIAEARGEFLALLDDDDLWPQDKLQWQVEALRQNPEAALVYGRPVCIDEAGAPTQALDTNGKPFWWLLQGPGGHIYKEMVDTNKIVSPGQCLIRRSVLASLEAPCFDPDRALQGCDDWDLWLRLSRRWEFLSFDRVALLYRLHPNNASRDTIKMSWSNWALRRKHYRAERNLLLRAHLGAYFYRSRIALAAAYLAQAHRARAMDDAGTTFARIATTLRIFPLFCFERGFLRFFFGTLRWFLKTKAGLRPRHSK